MQQDHKRNDWKWGVHREHLIVSSRRSMLLTVDISDNMYWPIFQSKTSWLSENQIFFFFFIFLLGELKNNKSSKTTGYDNKSKQTTSSSITKLKSLKINKHSRVYQCKQWTSFWHWLGGSQAGSEVHPTSLHDLLQSGCQTSGAHHIIYPVTRTLSLHSSPIKFNKKIKLNA